MRSLNDYSALLDQNTFKLLALKTRSDEDLMSACNNDEKVFQAIRNGKCGLMKVIKISDNPGIEKGKEHYGVATCFAENIGLFLSSEDAWFHTSTVQEIDWSNNQFKTLNSVYSFDFEELDDTEVINAIKNFIAAYASESEDKFARAAKVHD